MSLKQITFLSVSELDSFLNYYPFIYKEYLFKNYIVNFINIKLKKITVYKKSKKIFSIQYKSLKELQKFLKKNSCGVFVSIEEKIKNIPIFFLLKKLKLDTYYLHAHENYPHLNFSKKNFLLPIQFFYNSFEAKIFNFLISTGFIGPLSILFSSSRNEINYSRKKYKNILFFRIKYQKFKKIIKINNKELFKTRTNRVKKYTIFLDIAAPFHLDQINSGFKPINYKYYYSKINTLFFQISKISKTKIIIFPHPKYYKYTKYFSKKFKVIKKNQDLYLKKSKLVLLHHTSSIFKAINFKVKILQIQSMKFNNFIWTYNNFFKKKYKLDDIDLEENNTSKIKKKVFKSSTFYKEIEFNDKVDNLNLISKHISNEK